MDILVSSLRFELFHVLYPSVDKGLRQVFFEISCLECNICGGSSSLPYIAGIFTEPKWFRCQGGDTIFTCLSIYDA